jgi:hypothetical protein
MSLFQHHYTSYDFLGIHPSYGKRNMVPNKSLGFVVFGAVGLRIVGLGAWHVIRGVGGLDAGRGTKRDDMELIKMWVSEARVWLREPNELQRGDGRRGGRR